ncbi:hypothetical protein [Ornithinibacillus xuwenensis]|uniref:DUF4209 domain-containing protein n=1 Tax=Ornithinibacillus xuwenensis TaxID=3144668 RepID=A0ABU9XID5_9BACI
MAALINLLEEQDVSFTLKYYGLKDIATGWDVSAILDNKEMIKTYFLTKNLEEVNNIDDFIDYLTIIKIITMREVIPFIKSKEKQQHFKELTNLLDVSKDKINNGHIIQLINNYHPQLFEEKYRNYGLIDIIMEYLLKFQNGIKENVFCYIIEEFSFLVIDNYENIQSKIESSTNLFKAFFSTETIEKIFYIRFDKYLDILASTYNRTNGEQKVYLEKLVDKIVADIEDTITEINKDNILQYESNIRFMHSFLQLINHVKSNVFLEYEKLTSELLDKHILKYGQSRSYEIPTNLIIEMLNKEPNEFAKLLKLTHFLNHKTGKIECRLNFPQEGKQGLLDIVSSNVNSDEYFTRSHQRKLEIQTIVGSTTLFSILHNEELFHDSCAWYVEYLSYICKKLEYKKTDLLDDLFLLIQMIDNLLEAENKEDEKLMQSLCYGACMFVCAFSEKLLRESYFELMKNEEYIPKGKLTLGSLLSDNNSKFIEIFGENQIKHLLYYFGTYGEARIGFNYRNKIAHWSNLSSGELSITLFTKLLYIFTNIVNSLVAYFVNQDDEVEEEVSDRYIDSENDENSR